MNIRPDIASLDVPATIENANTIVVGGGGHVGIPLVLALAKAGLRVNVNDLNQQVLDTLKQGHLPFLVPANAWCSATRPTASRPYRDTDFMGKPVFDVWGDLEGAKIIR